MEPEVSETNEKRVPFSHALISFAAMAAIMFISVVLLGAEPQVPMVLGCVAAGIIAVINGNKWETILSGMLKGISCSLEAVLILLLIGCLIGVWIAAGTVPTIIYYGLKLISAKYFLAAAMLVCAVIAFAIGSWGTIGTIGVAFMAIGRALGIPAPMVAGCIVAGGYFGEVASPLSDVTNLAAAVAGKGIFGVVKRLSKTAVPAFIIAEAAMLALGLKFAAADVSQLADNILPLLFGLASSFRISLLTLLPMVIMLVCILVKLPAIPSILAGMLSGVAVAAAVQGASMAELLETCYRGFSGETGLKMLDELLTAGGMSTMSDTVMIIFVAMAYGGLMRGTGQIAALVAPICRRLRGRGGMVTATVVTSIIMNMLLPDQYLSISSPGQMYAAEYEKRGVDREELAAALLGGAVSSPLIPWNTCGIYCTTILGVGTAMYAPYAFFNLLLPVFVVLSALVFSKKRRER